MNSIIYSLFGWKELLATSNEKHYYELCNRLTDNQIRRKSVIENYLSRGSRGVTYISGNPELMHYIYVKKQDYDKAKYIMNNRKR